MANSNIFVYPGVPTADLFANTQAEGSNVIIDSTTDIAYYYKEGTGVLPLAGDPWTYLTLASDFTATSSTPANIPGLAFTPSASQTYVVEGQLLLRSEGTTIGVKPGVSWPTGLTDGAARIDTPNSSSSVVLANLNYSSSGSASGTDFPTSDTSFLGLLSATFLAGASPSGDFQLTLATE